MSDIFILNGIVIKVIKFVEDPSNIRDLEVTDEVLSPEDHEVLCDYICTYMLCLDVREGDKYYHHRSGMLDIATKGIFFILRKICEDHHIEFKFFNSIYFQDDILYVKL